MTYIHAFTYMSHREIVYSNVHENKPLQPIHNELEAKIVKLGLYKSHNALFINLSSIYKIKGYAPGLYLKAHYHESNP